MPQCEIDAPSVEGTSRGKLARSALWISCGRRSSDVRRKTYQGVSRVQIRIVQYAIEQRGEDLTYTPAGRDSGDGHHFLAPDGEVGHLERRGPVQLRLEARLELLLVLQPLLHQPSPSPQVGAPQLPECGQRVGPDARDGPAHGRVVPLGQVVPVVLPDE